ncbi:MAG: alpha-N-arabinofuranosidase [Planctomycetes bacterium]|nr:alpha-N-arabinofuranosidase [Planctomycetota bacterium]
MKATLSLDTHHHVGAIDRRIFSGFLEHLGRSVYEGAYDPGSPLADGDGFRTDVIAALAEMRMPLVRYPGGNFVSSYDWRDGVGPRATRPRRPDFAWRSVEPNTFGTDEFVRWCKKVGTAPMMAVNLGTLGAQQAGELVEYCNLGPGTYWADKRVANGALKPYAIKTWCLGNEMDGPWQAGHVPADEYARRADQAAKFMKGMDRTIEVIIAGSSGRGMATYMHYDRTLLEYTWNNIDYISAHRYSGNAGDSAHYLAEGVEIDRILDDYAGLLAYVRGVMPSDKQVYVSFDEWNVWYKNREADGRWTVAPHLLEEIYNFEDALICGQYLNSFIRHADSVKIACIAQLVNVIGPLMTRKDGLLVQSIYHPFVMLSANTAGRSLRTAIDSPTYKAGERGDVPMLDASVSHDDKTETACLSLINRDTERPLTVDVAFGDRKIAGVTQARVLSHRNLKAANQWDKKPVVTPRPANAKVTPGGGLRVSLPAPSMAVVCVKLAKR